MFKRKKKELSAAQIEAVETKDFFDRIVPGMIKFYTDHYICGNFYKSCWAVTEYPPNTEETAILAHLADRNGVTLRIYNRLVTSMEQRKIVQQAMRKNHMMTTTNDVNESIKAQDNIHDVVELLSELRRNKENLLHTAVFIELKAASEDKLKELQADISMELTRSKISVDRLLLRQKEGFLSVLPTGNNMFGSQFERVLPASSVANMYPLNYSGKTDKNGFYLGRDKYGSNVLVDFDRRRATMRSDRRLRMSTTLPASSATSVPEAMATPMSAAASAGASLMPSPTKATTAGFSAAASRAVCTGDARGTGSAGTPVAGSVPRRAGSASSAWTSRSFSRSVSAAALPAA